VATNADIPEFDAYFAGGFDEEASPLGAKGLGKLTAAASAAPPIADAVCHATGKRVRDLPATAENLLYAIPHDGMQNTRGRDQKGEAHASIRAI
jgi:xanthine dehydrogenase YagR molybdenum-binding subunit